MWTCSCRCVRAPPPLAILQNRGYILPHGFPLFGHVWALSKWGSILFSPLSLFGYVWAALLSLHASQFRPVRPLSFFIRAPIHASLIHLSYLLRHFFSILSVRFSSSRRGTHRATSSRPRANQRSNSNSAAPAIRSRAPLGSPTCARRRASNKRCAGVRGVPTDRVKSICPRMSTTITD